MPACALAIGSLSPYDPSLHMASDPPPGYYDFDEPAQDWQSSPEYLYTSEPAQPITKSHGRTTAKVKSASSDIVIHDEWETAAVKATRSEKRRVWDPVTDLKSPSHKEAPRNKSS